MERPQDDEPYYAIEGQITDQMYLGSRRRYKIQTPEGHLLLVDSEREWPTGADIRAWVRHDKVHVY
ncbi:MAG TPA: TOBE domain-containing protein [Bacillota bacterium]|nr:TOBE domain-containing protein [Bacillota bacterium]